MKKICLLYFFIFLFLNCNIHISKSSIFKNFLDIHTIDFQYRNIKKYPTEELVLNNNARVIIKNSSIDKIVVSFYLEAPSLYQTRLTAGSEKVILLYIKELFKNNLNRNKILLEEDIKIDGNFDFSRFSFKINSKYIYKALNIFLDSLIIKEWDKGLLTEILEKEKSNFNKKYKSDNEFYINYSLEKYVFNANPIFNSFDGNLFSLNTLNFSIIKEYYENNFSGNRMILFIYGNVNHPFKFNFLNFRNNFIIKNFSKNIYNRFISSRFKLSPYYLENKNNSNVILLNFYKAPSFLNDQYFVYLVTIRLFEEHAKFLFLDSVKIKFDSCMLNITNFGKVIFYTEADNIIQNILTFRKLIENHKDGRGAIFYYDRNSDKIIKEYKYQTEDKIAFLNVNQLLKKIKSEILKEYNFNNIDSEEIEKRYISIYFLLNREIEPEIIRERIVTINYDDIIEFTKNNFLNFSWALLAKSDVLKNTSKDFFLIK